MNFLKNKTFLAVLGVIALLRILPFILSRGGVQNFAGYYKLDFLVKDMGETFLIKVLVFGIALIGILLPGFILLSLAFERDKFLTYKKGIFIGLISNLVMVFLYFLAELTYWGQGLRVDDLVWLIIIVTIPLSMFYLTSFYGLSGFLFLLFTTIIQVGLFVSLIMSVVNNKSKSTMQVAMNQPEMNVSTSVNSNRNGSQQMNQSTATWTVRIPGQPENPVDTTTLQNWAKSGFVKADTMVTEVSTGYAYQAKQIPGIFSSKSYVTALLLSFFFGVFGVDRFYLGHVGVGLGKLFTFGGLGIWALIDFILIATKNVKDGQGIPLA